MPNSVLLMGSGSAGAPPAGLTIVGVDTKFGNAASVHTLTGVTAGALLVVSTGANATSTNAAVSSSPVLTWTKRVDANAGTSPSAEIWTATFTAGGNVTVTASWGAGVVQTSVLYTMTGQDTTIGAGTVAQTQNVADTNVTTTRTNSIIIAHSNNWNAPDGGAGGNLTLYRGTPNQSFYYRDPLHLTAWHYYYNAPTIQQYPIGYTNPSDIDNGTSTVVLEVRSLTGTGPTPDTTPPVMGVLSSPSHTHNSINLSWTAATDNVGVTGYEVYLNGALINTVVGTTYVISGLVPSTSYSIFVRAKDAAGNGNNSNTISVSTDSQPIDTTPPSAPVLSSPSKTAVSINVQWTASTDAGGMANYRVYRNNVLIDTVSIATLTYQHTGLTQLTSYTLRVDAVDTSNNVTPSNTLTVVTNPTADTTPPVFTNPALATPSANDIDINTVVLNWTAATDNVGVVAYDVYISPSTLFTSVSGTTLTATVSGLTANTGYTFFVRARDAAGNTGQTNSVTVTTDPLCTVNCGQPLTFTYLTNDYRRYWGGPEFWGGGDGALTLSFQHAHRYRRFVWNDWEGDTAGSYLFNDTSSNNRLRVFIEACIAQRQLASFGIMTCYPGFDSNNSFHTYKQFSNGTSNRSSAYPQYLHNLMQGESTKDWENGDCWVPNFNSLNYVNRFAALIVALKAFLDTTVPGRTFTYGNCVGYIDLRGMGAYGEWHSNGIISGNVNGYPGFVNPASNPTHAGTFPSSGRLIQIIDAQRTVLTDWPLTTILNSLDGNFPNGSSYNSTGLPNTAIPASVGQYIMSNGNAWGNIGWRRDQWGDINDYYRKVAQQTNGITGIPARWQTAPVVGEPPGYNNSDTEVNGIHMRALNAPYTNTEDGGNNGDQVNSQRPAMVGNSNYGYVNGSPLNINTYQTGNPAIEMRSAFTRMGCILRPVSSGGTVNLTSTQLIITIPWKNFGLAPQYKKNWVTTFEIRNSGGTLLWTATSSFNPFLLKPTDPTSTVVDTFTRPAISAGAHQLSVIIKDGYGYLEPLQLGITGRQDPSGSYILTTLNF